MDDPPLAAIARSAGIQVPQLTHRTNFLSALVVELLNASLGFDGELPIVFAAPRIFCRNLR
jgi:hypothetical protein